MRQFQRRLFGSDSTLNSLLNYRKHRVISSSPSLGTSGSQNRLAISFFTLTEFLPFSLDMLIPQSKEMSLYWSPEQIRIQSNKKNHHHHHYTSTQPTSEDLESMALPLSALLCF